jgi:hypothetical protein
MRPPKNSGRATEDALAKARRIANPILMNGAQAQTHELDFLVLAQGRHPLPQEPEPKLHVATCQVSSNVLLKR